MLLAKFKTVSLLLALALVGQAVAQTDAKKEEPKKVEPKPADPKVDKKPPKVEPDNVAPLNERLKKHEQEIARIRELMLKEINAEIDKLEAAIKKAQDEFMKGDRLAMRNSGRLIGEKARLQAMRVQVDRGIIGRGGALPATPIDVQLGLHLNVPPAALRQQLGLAKDTGLVIDKVNDDSAAGKAGLKTYDILVQFDGKAVPSDVAGFRKLLAGDAPGSAVDVVVVRQGKQETVKGLTLPAGAK
jgi:hypothetical protein